MYNYTVGNSDTITEVNSTAQFISFGIGAFLTAAMCIAACYNTCRQQHMTHKKNNVESYINALSNFKSLFSSGTNTDKHLTISQALTEIKLLDNITQKDTAKSLAAVKCLATPVFSVHAKTYGIEQTALRDIYAEIDDYMLDSFKKNNTSQQELNLFLEISIARSKLTLNDVQTEILKLNELQVNHRNNSHDGNNLRQHLLFNATVQTESSESYESELGKYYADISSKIKTPAFDINAKMLAAITYSEILFKLPEVKTAIDEFDKNLLSLAHTKITIDRKNPDNPVY